MSAGAPSAHGDPEKGLPVVEQARTPRSSKARPSIGWTIGGSMALAAAPELIGRYLYQAYGVGYGVTGTLTLGAIRGTPHLI